MLDSVLAALDSIEPAGAGTEFESDDRAQSQDYYMPPSDNGDSSELPVLRPRPRREAALVLMDGDVFDVQARRAVRIAAMLNEDDWNARVQFLGYLQRAGVVRALEAAGVAPRRYGALRRSRVGVGVVLRIGVFGGTFDPIHMGHLIVAEDARAALELDKALFIPAGQPWFKSYRQITEARHRLAMVRLAVEGNPDFDVTDIENQARRPKLHRGHANRAARTVPGCRVHRHTWG